MRYFFESHHYIPFNNYFVIGQQTLDTLNTFNVQGTMAEIQTLESLIQKTLESWEDNAI